jgi:hypothetical protein
MSEMDQVSYFIDGLKHSTRIEISYQAPATFNEAWAMAIKYDTAMYGLGRPVNTANRNNYQKHKTSTSYIQQYTLPTLMELDQAKIAKRKF